MFGTNRREGKSRTAVRAAYSKIESPAQYIQDNENVSSRGRNALLGIGPSMKHCAVGFESAYFRDICTFVHEKIVRYTYSVLHVFLFTRSAHSLGGVSRGGMGFSTRISNPLSPRKNPKQWRTPKISCVRHCSPPFSPSASGHIKRSVRCGQFVMKRGRRALLTEKKND